MSIDDLLRTSFESLSFNPNHATATLNLKSGDAAVSYTHLDVYKRQIFAPSKKNLII